MAKPVVPIVDVAEWLAAHHGQPIERLEALAGGFWSAAYAYEVDGQRLVLRLSHRGDGFAIDAAAARFASPQLPIPEVVGLGQALGCHWAISRRHDGRFLEDISVAEAATVREPFGRLLAALRSAPTSVGDPVEWHRNDRQGATSWRGWLLGELNDDGVGPRGGWRAKVAAHPLAESLFIECQARVEELLAVCPERRDLIHNDLLHQNVLVNPTGDQVTAVFSWKCSVLGDFLYDTALCTIWSPWHPGIEAIDAYRLTLSAADLSADDLRDAGLRHHCYELHIAAVHLGWNATKGTAEELARLIDVIRDILDRGPHPVG